MLEWITTDYADTGTFGRVCRGIYTVASPGGQDQGRIEKDPLAQQHGEDGAGDGQGPHGPPRGGRREARVLLFREWRSPWFHHYHHILLLLHSELSGLTVGGDGMFETQNTRAVDEQNAMSTFKISLTF